MLLTLCAPMQIRISYFQKLVTYEGESTMKVSRPRTQSTSKSDGSSPASLDRIAYAEACHLLGAGSMAMS